MSDSDTERLTTFLRNETENIQRSTQRFVKFGIIFAVIVAGYMGFILYMVKGFLEPQTLAILVGDQVAETLPEVIRSAEEGLAESAPAIASQVSLSFVQMIPEITEAGKREIESAHKEQIPFISDEFKVIINDYIQANGATLKAFAEDHNSQQFAEHFTEQMMAELGQQLETRLRDTYGRQDNLKYFDENLTYSLLAMDSTLTDLLEQEPEEMNRQQRLQRRILARLVQSVHEAAEE